MDVKALVVIGGAEPDTEIVASTPIATLDVLGRSVVQRVIDRLRYYGIRDIAVVSEHDLSARRVLEGRHTKTDGQQPWKHAEKAFSELSQGGDIVIVQRVGAYAEFDYEELVRFHLDQASRVTTVVAPDSDTADAFVIHGTRRNDAAYLLRHGLRTSRPPHVFYEFTGYVNRLRNAADLRRIAVDAFCGNATLRPTGDEVRPGVWIDATALVDKRSRILAPAFVGAHARVRQAAVITRCSVLEHHSIADRGTVVENTTLLPHTSVGAGLDVSHSVVGNRRIVHLGREVEIEIHDPKLVGVVSTAPLQLLGHVASLAGFLPAQIVRGFLRRTEPETAPTLADTVQTPSPSLKSSNEVQFPANLAVARRYGDE